MSDDTIKHYIGSGERVFIIDSKTGHVFREFKSERSARPHLRLLNAQNGDDAYEIQTRIIWRVMRSGRGSNLMGLRYSDPESAKAACEALNALKLDKDDLFRSWEWSATISGSPDKRSLASIGGTQ